MFRRNDRVTLVNAHDVTRGVIIDVSPVLIQIAQNDNHPQKLVTGQVISVFVLPEIEEDH